ncbi:molybdenum cofactor guanylyltransferase MobA [Microvirga sp. GCM10011540]|uniref:molybdenum cofactor guanylyltransferase MobA n=1 Tax=Microvirga sp. GCM10011540 TaxID=3317338 RepID=UPI00366C0E90
MAEGVPQVYPPTLGVVLAGGLARRMEGADKSLQLLRGRPLLNHVLERLSPQCDEVVINANGNPERFERLGRPVVPDPVPGNPGPLAGLLAALEWAATAKPGIEWVASVPCDTPFIPEDLVSRLHQARAAAGTSIAWASSGPRTHYAVGLWPVDLREDLRDALVARKLQSIREWAGTHGAARAEWNIEAADPFFNINTAADLAEAERVVGDADSR